MSDVSSVLLFLLEPFPGIVDRQAQLRVCIEGGDVRYMLLVVTRSISLQRRRP